MTERFRMATYIEWDPADGAGPKFCGLVDGQPLILSRGDSGVLVSDMYCDPMGFIAAAHAVAIRAKMDGGEILLCKVTGRCACVARPVLVWSEGEDPKEEVGEKKRRRVPEKV